MNGEITTDFNNSDDEAYAIALQGNKIIAGGYAYTPGKDFALARYTADGTLDASFGENGKLTGQFPSSDTYFTSTAIQGDKIIAAGYARYTKGVSGNDFALARYTVRWSSGLFLWSEWKSNN